MQEVSPRSTRLWKQSASRHDLLPKLEPTKFPVSMFQIESNTTSGPCNGAQGPDDSPDLICRCGAGSPTQQKSEIRNSWMGCLWFPSLQRCPLKIFEPGLCKYFQLHWTNTAFSRCDFFHPKGHLSMSFAAIVFHKFNRASLDNWYTMALGY